MSEILIFASGCMTALSAISVYLLVKQARKDRDDIRDHLSRLTSATTQHGDMLQRLAADAYAQDRDLEQLSKRVGITRYRGE